MYVKLFVATDCLYSTSYKVKEEHKHLEQLWEQYQHQLLKQQSTLLVSAYKIFLDIPSGFDC